MSVLQRFANVARGLVRARLHPDPDTAAAQAALEKELAGDTPPRTVQRGDPRRRVRDLDPDAEVPTDPGLPAEPEPPGPPQTDADGNVKRTL
jgi:hypothetical protein